MTETRAQGTSGADPMPPATESGGYRAPRSVEDVTRSNVELIRRLDQAAVERGSAADRAAEQQHRDHQDG